VSGTRILALAAVVLCGAVGYQYWQASQIPAPTLEPGERAGSVNLSAPEHVEIHHEQTQNSIMIARDNPSEGRVGGTTPRVFQRPQIATGSLALVRNTGPAADDRPWWQRLDPMSIILLAFAAFLAIWGVLTAAIKKGPGGPMSND